MTAEYKVDGDVAVITLNNPPVNGLGHATRSAVVDGIQKALADAAIKAIVITGAGKAFSGGADIREFNTPKVLADPTLHQLIATLENSTKPVVAALHSVAMGGGLELALGCNYRVASPGAQIALPEVKLGLLPGAGGTQRLPRVVGLETGLEMIVRGNPVRSEKLAGTRLFDRIIEDELLPGAIAFARQIADLRPLPKVRDIVIEHPGHEVLLQRWRDLARTEFRFLPAPAKCVDAISAAVSLPLEQGLKAERALFVELVQGPESQSLRHAFFAERAAAKIADVAPGTPVREIHVAAVVGAGTMGSGIAMAFANAGIPVRLLDTSEEALDLGLANIRKNYENSARKGKLTPELMTQRINLIQPTLEYLDIASTDIVVEAVFEEMAVKERVFGKLDQVMKPGAILATNTSTLDVNRIAAFTSRPQDVVGLHFFSPAHVMRLLEVVRGAATATDVLATAMALAKRLKKVGVVSGVCDGFIGNRMLEPYFQQAYFLLEEGCTPQQVDRAIEEFGFAMGPFRMSDMAGNDISWAIRKRRVAEHPDLVFSRIADLVCEAGRFGQKTGAGWYDYQPGDRSAHPSDAVAQMIAGHVAQLGVAQRAISDEEIVERLVYALVNEGANILEEGIAQRASDIDMVYLAGYGFPLHRGGPMFHADTVGLEKVVASIEGFARGWQGQTWKVAPLLKQLAQQGKTFN